jgi:hypothetical protein
MFGSSKAAESFNQFNFFVAQNGNVHKIVFDFRQKKSPVSALIVCLFQMAETR